MVKIIHYEVYADRGDGWKLVDQFSSDQRQEAINLAKEIENTDNVAVKIIREIFDVQDNSYQESVEYISGLNRKKRKKTSNKHYAGSNYGGEYNVEYEKNEPEAPSHGIAFAVLKLVSIIILCLVFANLLMSLALPLVEVLIPEDRRRPVMFFAFFFIFLLLAVPLIIKKVPWSAFYAYKERKKVINERRFFDKAEAIIRRYNLNDDYEESIAPTYPEAPLEHKRYIVEFLTQILGSLDAQISLRDSFTRLGIKLVVYGGCLELSRYCGLIISEANSLLYESFKIIDGDNPDLSGFYEAKKTYKDNKVAIFLTGVGAYLMAQIIKEEKMDSYILKVTMNKWLELNKIPEPALPQEDSESAAEPQKMEKEIIFKCMANIRSQVNFYDDENAVSSEDVNAVRGEIRNILANLVAKFDGENVIESGEITSVQFKKLNNAVHFVIDFLNDVESYKDASDSNGLLVESKCSVLEMPTDDEPNLSPYVADIFEHTYNNEIIVNEIIKDELTDSKYEFEDLGEKKLSRTVQTQSLYKLVY